MFTVNFYVTCFVSRETQYGKNLQDSIGKRFFTGLYIRYLIPCLNTFWLNCQHLAQQFLANPPSQHKNSQK